MREKTLLNHITGITAGYDFSVPLHHFLKNYFRQHKQLGSRDRKIISSGSYAWYRCGLLFKNISAEEKLTWSLFLTGENNLLVKFLFDTYKITDEGINLKERLLAIHKKLSVLSFNEAFPFLDHLSVQIDKEAFATSLLQQPFTWIRMRHGYENIILEELQQGGISVQATEGQSLGFLPAVALNSLPSYLKGHFEIQDLSSQQTVSLLTKNCGERWWDCCSGSGGKTLMMADRYPNTHFLITDNRASILENAAFRLRRAQVKNFNAMQLNLLKNFRLSQTFDGIIADVPCSGSGTWSRSPENFWNFDFKTIADYAKQQKAIIRQIIPYLKQDGLLLYITCSAFADENENNIQQIASTCNLTVVQQKYFHGYQHRADTMFGCLLRKESPT